jgi:heptosyltransferase I
VRVLIVRVGAMGDVLHALPAVAALRAAQPDWVIDWVVDTRWAALLADSGRGPVVNAVHIAPTKQWSAKPFSWATLKSVLGLRRDLRGARYDVVVDMQGTLRSAVIGWMAGAKGFVGYADPREAAAARFYKTKAVRRGVHVVEQGAALLGDACGIELKPRAAALPRIEWAENWAEQEAVLARPLGVLGAGGGWGAKHWPAARYGELAVRLKRMGFDVVVNAPKKDDPVALAVVEASEGEARMVVCNVAGLVALLRRVDLFVGGDSGPTHLAATLAVPTVALFGPTDPARNGPWGPGVCRVVRDPESLTSYKRVQEPEARLAKLPVEDVVEAIWEILPPTSENPDMGHPFSR